MLGEVEITRLNKALLGKQPKHCDILFTPLSCSFYFWSVEFVLVFFFLV